MYMRGLLEMHFIKTEEAVDKYKFEYNSEYKENFHTLRSSNKYNLL